MAKRSSSEFSARWTLPDKPVIALVSGGLDSMLLAEVLHEHGCLAGVYHANYGLRGADSDADAAGVEAWAREHGVPFRADRFSLTPETPDLQAVAREQRYSGARAWANKEGVESLATAHHADDAVETLLMNAARGSGLSGLVSLAESRPGLIRPFWRCAKDELRREALKRGLVWREDSSNALPKYARNRIRLEVLPALSRALPQAETGLHKTVYLLRQTHRFLHDALEREAGGYLVESTVWPSVWELDTAVWEHPHAELLVHHVLNPFGGWEAEQLAPLRSAQVGAHVARNGWELWVERDRWLIVSAEAKKRLRIAPQTFDFEEAGSWTGWLWDEGAKIMRNAAWSASAASVARREDGSLGTPAEPVVAPRDGRLTGVWREWKDGDWMTPLGLSGRKKVSDVLTDAKVPSFARKFHPVWAASEEEGEVFWVPGIRLAQSVSVRELSRYFWEIRAQYL